jgi:hypothetical protein
MTKRRTQKPYWEMNTQELAAATAEFDKEFVADTFGPLTPEGRAKWEAWKRKSARPKDGQAERLVAVKLAKDLLARSDALAKRMGISRADLITRGLKAVLAAEGEL